MNKMSFLSIIGIALASAFSSCSSDVEMHRPETPSLPDLPLVEGIHTFNAPLYWSVYEYCFELEKQGVPSSQMDITSTQWDNITDWVASELLPYGYDMVCTDGFIPMRAEDNTGYMTHYGSVSLKDLVSKCKAKGLKVGVYDNPLWIHGDDSTPIPGTDKKFGDLHYTGNTVVKNPNVDDLWFSWVCVEKEGAREYIDGFFKHYSDLGIKFIRMDFLSWFEDGHDRGMGTVGKGYGRDSYARALAYIAESAKKYGVFTSLVMPHLYNDAELESKYGNMFRIVADTGDGGWTHCSSRDRGQAYSTWPNCNNMFDGFVYWSHVSGRRAAILDGDFIRLNKFETDAEKQTVISLQLMAGGPIAVADQYDTIGTDMVFYTNSELLELNKDGFAGQPLNDSLSDRDNQIWFGELSTGEMVVGLFNRDDSDAVRSVSLSGIGLSGEWKIRDLWNHQDEGTISEELAYSVPAHGCKIIKMTKQS